MIFSTPTTIPIEVCYIPTDVRSRYRATWCQSADFRVCKFNITGHCARAGRFVVDLVRPVNGLPDDLPRGAAAGLAELIKDALKQRYPEVSVKSSVIDLLASSRDSYSRSA